MKSAVPYDFILDYLPAAIIVKKAFGMHYIYWNKKNMLILRKLSKNPHLNGIWIASATEHHASLKADVPAIGNFVLENGKTLDSDWQLLKEGEDDFERAVIKICGFISHGDRRIGKLTAKSSLLN